MTDPAAVAGHPQPWDPCVQCSVERPGHIAGAAVRDGLCVAHLDPVSLGYYLKDCEVLDARGCQVSAALLKLLTEAGNGKPSRVFGASDFTDATFTEGANFTDVTFTKGASFIEATFTRSAEFMGARFTEGADFSGVTFTKGASFMLATFTKRADFTEATFTKTADFTEATFTEGANFLLATFTGAAGFPEVTFTKSADFTEATFTEGAEFTNATFTKNASFMLATFAKSASFVGVTFTKGATFTGCRFLSRVPAFDAFTCAGPFVFEPDSALAAWHLSGGAQEFLGEASASGVRSLRAVVEESRNEQGANVLYEIEMRCRQRELRDQGPSRWPERSILRVYADAAGFGVRPVPPARAWLILVSLVFVVLLSSGFKSATPPVPGAAGPAVVVGASRSDCPASTQPPSDAALFAIRAAVPGLDVREECLTSLGRWTVTFDRIFGALLLGLFGLAVRSQVKRGT